MQPHVSHSHRKLAAAALLLLIVLAFALPVAFAQSGESPAAPDIVGGSPAAAGEFPWQIALIDAGSNPYYGQFCGGSLIDANWIVTAAHCVESPTRPSDIQVVAGIRILSSSQSTGWQRLGVKRIIVHPSFNSWTYNNDIALLELSTAAVLGPTAGGETVGLIPLVESTIGTLVNEMSTVSGWGTTSYGGYSPDALMRVDVPIVSNANCNDSNSYNGSITDNMLCAGYDAGGKDSCQGDSGGPLVINDGGTWKLAGIVSWGEGCAYQNLHGVYTRVSRYTDWVEGYVDAPVTPAPTISGFSPASGGAGTSVTITGTNFTGTTSVKFNGRSAAFTVNSATQITAVVPANAGTGKITIQTPTDRVVSASSFVYVQPPRLVQFSPLSGRPGTVVTITGRNLRDAEVTFSGVAATIRRNTATRIVAVVPAGAVTGKVAITTPGGTVVSARNFRVR